jgi:hypothetical protein
MSNHQPNSLDDAPDAESLRRRADRCHELAKGAETRRASEALIELGDKLHAAARAAEVVEKWSVH